MTRPDLVAGDLCVGCALCCDGTLFDHGKLEDDEVNGPFGAQAKRKQIKSAPFFLQPCVFQGNGQCNIYEHRFGVCRAFKCALLRRVEAGEMSLDAARSTVAEALDLRAAVVAEDPRAGTNSIRQRLRKRLALQLADDTADDREAVARRVLRLTLLDAFLEKWFRLKGIPASEENRLSSAEPTIARADRARPRRGKSPRRSRP